MKDNSIAEALLSMATHNTKLKMKIAILEADNAFLCASLAILNAKKQNEIFEIERMYGGIEK